MSFFPISKGTLLGFLVVLFVFAATECQAEEQVIEVVGIGECSDCKELNIHSKHAFPGLHVTIDCKNHYGTMKRWGVGELNEEGKFKVSISKEMLKDGNLKHECYAQLHSASLAPCPAQNGLKSIKIVAKNDADGKHITFEPAQKLTFSRELCTSATFLPYHKPLPKIDLKHHFGHHKKPLPPTVPTPVPITPEPPVTIPKTPEPPVTIPKTPEPPVTKPEPPSKPAKPCPPEPKKNPKPEKPKKDEPKKKKPEKPKKEIPPVVKPPVEKPPIVTPPITSPPIEKPPIKKLPCPTIIPKLPPKDYHHPKLPPFPTIPPFPKLPPKDYHHPKLPPLPTVPPKYLHHPKLPHYPPSPHIPHA